MENVIVTEGLTKRFKERTVVDSLDLSVHSGEIFGFLGPNGAGKTTTIGMLLGLVQPSAGRAFVLGHDIQHKPALALRSVGAMIEAPAFYPYLSGRDNLRVLARASGLADSAVDSALETVDLNTRGKDQFKTYSQGMRQRLGLAAALMHNPKLIMLDEPTNGLDPAGQHDIRILIRQLAQSGHTIFLSSHLLNDIEQLCDRVAILKSGKLLACGAVSELLHRGNGLVLRVAGDRAEAQAILAKVAWIKSISEQNDSLVLDVPSERSPEITMLLASHGIAVAELRAHESRLEDVFLELTKQ